MIASPSELLSVIDTIIESDDEGLRAPALHALKEELELNPNDTAERAWSLLQLPIVYRPMEIIHNLEHGREALNHIETVAGFGFEDNGSMAIAEANYGDIDRALQYVQATADGVGAPGFSLSQPEALSGYSMLFPIVHRIFGIQPRAHERRIAVRPQIPTGWQSIRIDRVPVGDTAIGVARDQRDGAVHYTVTIANAGWTVDFHRPRADQGHTVILNGTELMGDTRSLSFQ